MRKWVIVGFASTCLLAAWLLVPRAPETGPDEPFPTIDLLGGPIEEQASYQRVLADGEFRIRPFLAEPMSFEVPNGMKIVGESVFLFDYEPMKVYRFDADGRLTGTFGSGRGREPGQLTHLTDVTTAGDAIYVIDSMGRTISRFHSDGAYISRLSFEEQYSRAALLPDRIVTRAIWDDMFHYHDFSGRLLGSNGRIENRDPVQSGGDLHALADGKFIFATTWGSYIFYLDGNGNLARAVRTVDRQPFPFEASQEGQAPEGRGYDLSLMFRSNVDHDANRLYLATAHTTYERTWQTGFLDVYELDPGSNLRSYPIPMSARGAGWLDGRLVVLTRDPAEPLVTLEWME